MSDLASEFSQRILDAAKEKRALRIRGGGSKDFHARALDGELLETSAYHGIVNYEPTELIVTARAGTLLTQLEAALAERGQMLGFEPPRLSPASTLGGCVAAGWSGPRRPYAGSVRDSVLGMRVINGRGENLHFGGEVMKNVAGFDVSRLMTGSFGTLGLILEVSLKVLPRPRHEQTLRFDMDAARAIESMNRWAGEPLPVSGTLWLDGKLYVRLSGPETAIRSAREKMGGETEPDAANVWARVRDQSLDIFLGTVWRLSIKSSTPAADLPGKQVMEWNGALRWISGGTEAALVHEIARKSGGHALLYRGAGASRGVYRLDAATLKLHQRIKSAMDPSSVFGPGRLHPQI
ncbi:MAG: glycolate oxidase subunit GlcE [Betaproteobacteria bacterium]|nr:glycolate oxidase subunit GlcE [Betaproteobacteria bacterium]